MNNIKINTYKNALVEVESALNCLNKYEYEKIPVNIIEMIKTNKNEDYVYEYDENLNYDEWKFMPETKAILYNIIKKYMLSTEQVEFLNKKEIYENNIKEKEKKKLYGEINIFKKDDEQRKKDSNNEIIKYENKNIIKKIINKIKQFFRKINIE